MQNRDSILIRPFAFIALIVTVSTPLRAQTVGDSVRVFSADTTIIGRITGLSDERFEFANGRSAAYRDLDRLSPVLAYILGQGVADVGKEKARVERTTQDP